MAKKPGRRPSQGGSSSRKRTRSKSHASSPRSMDGFGDPFDDISVTNKEEDIKRRRRDMTPIQAPKNWRKGLMQALAILGLALLILSPIVSVSAALMANTSASISKNRADDLYNPNIRARYGDLGKSVIEAWFGGAQQIVPVANNVQWPNKPPVEGVGLAPNKETRDIVRTQLDSAGTADIDNIFLTSAGGNSLSVANSVSEDEANDLSRSYQETLYYSAMLNNMPVTISVVFFVPDINDTTRLPILAAAPIISAPNPIGSTSEGLVMNPGATQTRPAYELTDNDLTMLNEWAKAYVEGNQKQLKIITGDTNNDAYYRGLTGWELDSSKVTPRWAYIRESDNYVVAQVEFTMSQVNTIADRGPTQRDPRNPSQNQSLGTPNPKGERFTTTQAMDVVISGAGRGNPRIVAWGMPGTWSTLEPYGNALTQKDLEQLGLDLGKVQDSNEALHEEDKGEGTGSPVVESGSSASEEAGADEQQVVVPAE